MSTTVTYKGQTLTTVSNQTKVLNTSGTWLEDDITLVDSSASAPTLQSKSASPTESQQTITADTGYDGLSSVQINAISSSYIGSGVTQNDSTDLTVSGATVTAPAGYYASSASKSIASGSATTPATTITANPTISVNASGLITATANASQGVTPTVSAGYVSSGTSGTITVSGSNTSQLTTQAAKTVNPTESEQNAVAANVYTTGIIKVGAISSTYVGSGIERKTFTLEDALAGLDGEGGYIFVDAGYYANDATISVGTANSDNKPTISVNSTTGLITSSIDIASGWVTTGNAETRTTTQQLTTQAAKTVTPTTSSQTAVAAGVYTTGAVTVAAMPNGALSNPSISVSSSGLITATSGVGTAGYLGTSATASNTQQLTTQAATTYNTSTTDQTIASGRYLTGAQTIKAVTTSNLTAANVKAGTVVQVGDSNDADRIASVTGTFTSDATASASDIVSGQTAYVNGNKVTGSLVIQHFYQGSSSPSASLGENGDIYLQS